MDAVCWTLPPTGQVYTLTQYDFTVGTYPYGVVVSTDGNTLYGSDMNAHVIRQTDIVTRVVTILAGSGTQAHVDGTGAAASFRHPTGVCISPDGTQLYVADMNNHRIRRVTIAGGVVTTISGSGVAVSADGTGVGATHRNPVGCSVSPDGSRLYVADQAGRKIRQIILATTVVTTLAEPAGGFTQPRDVAVSPDGSVLYISDGNGHRLFQLVIATGAVSILAGSGTGAHADGTGEAASFKRPSGLALSSNGSLLMVADNQNYRIRQVVLPTGVVTTPYGSGASAGTNAIGTAAKFVGPTSVAFSPNDAFLFVGDGHRYGRVRQIFLRGR